MEKVRIELSQSEAREVRRILEDDRAVEVNGRTKTMLTRALGQIDKALNGGRH